MPRHDWRCTKCGAEIDVVRRIGAHSEVPEGDELNRIKSEEQKKCEHEWQKFIKTAPDAAYGSGWTPHGGSGKGNW
jgi:predicted nucleic acid-binding Zn ribbon protein